MKKTRLLYGLLATVLMLAAAGCEQEEVRITLDRTVLQMEVNDTQMLTATVEPSTGESVTWVSSNPEVATVTAGAVVAVSDGRAEIRASVGDAVAVCVVYVTQPGGTYWGEYELVWEDNFDGAALDTTNWNIENGGGGWGNQEKQHYTGRPENLRVEDGCLVIEARREDYGGNQYTSARITTQGKREFVYGKMEARICLPAGVPIIAGEQGICSGCGIATLSISYYDLGYATGEMAAKILTGEADISTMPIQYTNVTKKYNPTICEELGLTVPEGYEAIEEA